MSHEGKLVQVIATKRWGAPLGWSAPEVNGNYSIKSHGKFVVIPIGSWVMIVSREPREKSASYWLGDSVCFLYDGRTLYTNDADGFKW